MNQRIVKPPACNMGVREELTRRPWIAVVTVAIGFTIIALNLFSRGGTNAQPTAPSRVYFSDDDGKTFFADDAALIPPFDHNGHTAVMAMVFKCPGKQPFIGYLLRFNHEGRTALAALSESQRRSADAKVIGIK
ncbi:MAG TPA: hypothetical protein VLI90_19230, partial [Tepidisphaeraceae bacterium]|nr:hypothetical protein [Tepidisphaeraceae bacterium]